MRFDAPRLSVSSLCLLVLTWAGTAHGQNGTDAARRAAATRVQPGDRIVIQLLGEGIPADTAFVTERGEAAFPKLGVVPVTQLTIRALEDTLRTRYAEFLRNPALQLVFLRRIVVNGEVENPDVYWVDVAATLRDVIAQAGGVTSDGNRGKVYIVRDGTRTHVPDWERARDESADLRSGDQVIVGRKSWLALNFLPAVTTTVVVASLLLSLRN